MDRAVFRPIYPPKLPDRVRRPAVLRRRPFPTACSPHFPGFPKSSPLLVSNCRSLSVFHRLVVAGYNGVMSGLGRSVARIAVPSLIVATLVFPAVFQLRTADGQVVLPGRVAASGVTKPSPLYDFALNAMAAGDFAGALDAARREYQGCLQLGLQRWIDSIAALTVMGECQYELGRFQEAVAAYDEALTLAALHGDWLMSVRFPLQPLMARGGQRAAGWARSQRNAAPASLPETMPIRLGAADPQRVLENGGVLAAAVDYPLRPQEIIRSLVIAIYRRADLVGPLGCDRPCFQGIAASLKRRPAPPTHFSQAWIDIALGMTHWAESRPELAEPLLSRGLLLENRFDHALSTWGLIGLGRIRLTAGKPEEAVPLFAEAAASAAEHGDARALEEAFYYAGVSARAAGVQNATQTMDEAIEWARGRFPVLHARLLAMRAEDLAYAGTLDLATRRLGEIDERLLRGDPGKGSLGAEASYAAAMVGLISGQVARGDRDLQHAITLAQGRSTRLFQLNALAASVGGGNASVSDRQADLQFETLLAEPSAAEQMGDALGVLATLTADRGGGFQAWAVAARERGDTRFLDVAEAGRRERWLVKQPLGGRRLAINRLLASAGKDLPENLREQRERLLAAHPEYGGLSQTLEQQRRQRLETLAATVGIAPEGSDLWPREASRQLAALGQEQAAMVAAMSASRDVASRVFPPLEKTETIRGRLPDRHLVLSFHWLATGLYAALESRERAALWRIEDLVGVRRELTNLARGLCLFDEIGPVTSERLRASDWVGPAARLERLLFAPGKVSLGTGIDDLTIVPDGLLWYLPFEILPVEPGGGPEAMRLRDACRIRYAPSRSMAVMPRRPSRERPAGVFASRLYRGDRPEDAAATLATFSGARSRVLIMSPTAAGVPVSPTAAVLGTLVVLDELPAASPFHQRQLVAAIAGRPGLTFGDWLAEPEASVQCMVLPGFQSAMAAGLTRPGMATGEDLAMAATGLVAMGSETCLIGRWCVGGRMSAELARAFLVDRLGRDSGDVSAAESWYRAIELVAAEPPDPELEPRLKVVNGQGLRDGKHPFFWSGGLLIDTGLRGAADADADADAAATRKAAP